jgi:hypothetical protein
MIRSIAARRFELKDSFMNKGDFPMPASKRKGLKRMFMLSWTGARFAVRKQRIAHVLAIAMLFAMSEVSQGIAAQAADPTTVTATRSIKTPSGKRRERVHRRAQYRRYPDADTLQPLRVRKEARPHNAVRPCEGWIAGCRV